MNEPDAAEVDDLPDGEREEDDRLSPREHVRTVFPTIALGFMLLAAASVAGIGGVVATGLGGEPIERPDRLTFSVETGGNDTAIVVSHPDGAVPSEDRVVVVDEAGTRVPWSDLSTAEGEARITGRSALACPAQGSTYRVVFEGRAADHTVDAYEVDAPIPASVVERCEAAN
ncbi:hypothetical protein Hbl1158_05075 [Halobaculum sp. CBA1158]|uniref:hypothetical protein n=1 Tax=Halobaculum sp. CBA1158 TaxID=2904243 RepID=UPI001F1E7ACC|nr:hypothetical protein [Halobaculum sp. CBA1158]UIP00732.1 hypothetical protein Hbl1158_05075 [Halobaculum sp. CBA1158]